MTQAVGDSFEPFSKTRLKLSIRLVPFGESVFLFVCLFACLFLGQCVLVIVTAK